MPSRVIRESLIDSERYWSVTLEARQLFWHLMLLADDFGCVSLAPVFIRRRCFDDAPSLAKIEKLLSQLQDEDLIRIYAVGASRYGFIPRFRQRLQRMTLKNPAPPELLLGDDDDAQEKFKKIRAVNTIQAGSQRCSIGAPSTEVKGSEVKGSEVEGEVEGKRTAQIVKSAKEWAIDLGIERSPGEGEGAFQVRVVAAVARHKTEITQ